MFALIILSTVKPAPFDYAAPERVEEVLSLLDEYAQDGRVLAGGQSLVPLLALRMARFRMLVDVNRVEQLRGVARSDGELVIGATTRQAAIAQDELVLRHAPLLAEATRYIGHFQIRNRGTIGGSLAHADPTAEYPAALLALDGEVEVAGASSRRRIPAAELIRFPYVTTLAPGELLVSVQVPIPTMRTGCAVQEIARRPGDFALVGGMATVSRAEDDTVAAARVVMFGVAGRPVRLTALEEELVGHRQPPATLGDSCGRVASDLNPPSDTQASAAYRRRVAGQLAARLVRRAMERSLEVVSA